MEFAIVVTVRDNPDKRKAPLHEFTQTSTVTVDDSLLIGSVGAEMLRAAVDSLEQRLILVAMEAPTRTPSQRIRRQKPVDLDNPPKPSMLMTEEEQGAYFAAMNRDDARDERNGQSD